MTRHVEYAVLCADGRVHTGNVFEYGLYDIDRERVCRRADQDAGRSWCGGAPHVLATRERIVTDWQVVAHPTEEHRA